MEDNAKEFFRFLAPTERLSLQGFTPAIIKGFPDVGLGVKAAGNAYPVNLICATAYPMVKAIVQAVEAGKLDLGPSPLGCLGSECLNLGARLGPDQHRLLNAYIEALKESPPPLSGLPAAASPEAKAKGKAKANSTKHKAKAKGRAKVHSSSKREEVELASRRNRRKRED